MNSLHTHTTRPRTKAGLSASRRRLLEIMQRVGFGQIKLAIQDGEPCFVPPPKITREIKMGAGDGPRPELSLADFILKASVIELFQYLSHLRDDSIVVEIRNGLPYRLIVQQQDVDLDEA